MENEEKIYSLIVNRSTDPRILNFIDKYLSKRSTDVSSRFKDYGDTLIFYFKQKLGGSLECKGFDSIKEFCEIKTKNIITPKHFLKLINDAETKNQRLKIERGELLNYKLKEFIKFMNENPSIFCPHDKIIIDQTSAEIVRGEFAVFTKEFLRD